MADELERLRLAGERRLFRNGQLLVKRRRKDVRMNTGFGLQGPRKKS